VELAELVLSHYLRISDSKSAASVSQLIVDHMYYKHDSHAVAVRRAHLFNKTWGKYGDLHPACVGRIAMPVGGKLPSASAVHPAAFLGNPTVNPPPFNPGQRLQELCTYIFKYGDKRIKTHALLALVHHHALHDRYYKARDLLLISHISEFADKFDIKTQILYNRAIATLGLCAFRLGLYQKAHDCLTGICSGRVKELLAQGLMRWSDKDPEQEKIERRRQMPFHMHINPDLLELCHLASAMILELPHLARSTNAAAGAHQTVVSRIFRKFLSGYSKQAFRGPPENTREHVLAATKALLSGEWQKALDLLMGLEVWKLIPNDGAENARVLLRARIKEEAVRTYLLLNGDHYESLSLNYLTEMFGMEEAAVRRIISRMIFNKEISAAWEPNNVLTMYRTEASALQTLSQGLAEKLSLLLESNERILDPLVGVYGYKDDWNARGGEGRSGKYANTGDAGGQNRNKFRSGGGGGGGGGGYKSGNRPALARQQNQQRGGRDNKGRTGGPNQGGAGGGAPRNAWNAPGKGTPGTTKPRGAVGGEPVAAQQPAQQSTPKRWGPSA
jgi:translation initiation factor 3 subunit C